MEVLVGPTFSIDVSSSSEYVRDRNGVPPPQEEDGAASSCSSSKEEKDGVGEIGSGAGFGGGGEAPDYDDDDDDDSDASSSIGVPDDDSDDDGSPTSEGVDDEVQSNLNRGLASIGSLEDSLPIKRGLSNHFSGKSKSFANLSEACSTKVLEKPENPFNKRRRVLIQAKLLRKSSFYTWRNPKSMPLLALKEEEEEEAPSSPRAKPEEDEDDDDEEEQTVPKWQQRRAKNMKSFSCFSLSEMENHHLQHLQE